MVNLPTIYSNTLHARAAQLAQERELAYRLRYRVYCLERGYEDPTAYPDGCERDAFDDDAHHVLVTQRACGSALGAARLILDGAGSGVLPVEMHGSGSVARHLAELRGPGSARVAEISRLAVARGAGSQHLAASRVHWQGAPAGGPPSRSVFLGLMAALFAASWNAGVSHWVALLSAGMLRTLAALGMPCHPIGSIIDYRGLRQPVMGRLDPLWQGVSERSSGVATLARDLGVPSDPVWSASDRDHERQERVGPAS